MLILYIVSYVNVDTASFADGKGGKEKMFGFFFCLTYVYSWDRLLPYHLLIYTWMWSYMWSIYMHAGRAFILLETCC